MGLNAWLTLAAIFMSPIAAVAISLVFESRRRKRDGRMLILRQILITRHLPGDPSYSAAINLVPAEFNDNANVMGAYKTYQVAINSAASDQLEVIARLNMSVRAAQTKLIFAMMRSLKLKASEADIPLEAYAAKGMIERDNLYLESLRSQKRIADALEESMREPEDRG